MARTTAGPPPWHFRLAKALIRRGWRGPGLWIRAAGALGLLNRPAAYQLADDIRIEIPICRSEYWWDEQEVRGYERAAISTLAGELRGMPRPWTLMDCGADVGLFSALLAAELNGALNVVAFEPSQFAYRYLRRNMASLPGECSAWQAAVADFRGLGRLAASPNDPSQHAYFLESEPAGDVTVVTLDNFLSDTTGTLAIKLDIEGGELQALRGGEETIRQARDLIVVFEAHRDVMRRTGDDPIECLRYLRSIRPFRASVAEQPMKILNDERGFFDQFPDVTIANIVCTTRTAP